MKSDIIYLIKNGNEQAFEDIYKEYYSRLYTYVFGYVREKEETKEIIQTTFIALWDKKEELADDIKIHAWLFTVVKNKCLNHIRDKMNRLTFQNNMELHESERLKWQTCTLQSFIPEEITMTEIQQQVDQAILQMPEQCKQVFCLSRYEGLSHKEIGQQLNITTKTVENQITKALKIVRKNLTDYYFFLFLL